MPLIRYNSIAQTSSPDKLQGINIVAPASGKLEIITNPALLSLGEGVVIKVESHHVIAPINGTVMEVIPAHGKIIVQAKNKLKFLLQLPSTYIEHLGLGIKILPAKGALVAAGDTLMTLDLYKIQQHMKPVLLEFLCLDVTPFRRVQVPHKAVEVGKDIVFSLVPLPPKK